LELELSTLEQRILRSVLGYGQTNEVRLKADFLPNSGEIGACIESLVIKGFLEKRAGEILASRKVIKIADLLGDPPIRPLTLHG
jgi:hypothetical protein